MILALASGSALVSLAIWVIVLVLIVVGSQWVIGKLGLPANIAQIVVVLIGVLALVLFLQRLFPVLGFHGL